uniref:Uncharacterized protein n=1 Tax=Magallana gigas TaxID=29159 RepID=K1PMD3_MAGGI
MSNSTKDVGSEKAVDGLFTDRGSGGQCTLSDGGHYTAEWRVDLGSVVSISRINIYYMTDNQDPGPYVHRLAGFSLYVSNTTSKLDGQLCYKDETGGTPSVNQIISCSIVGRYDAVEAMVMVVFIRVQHTVLIVTPIQETV